MKINLYRLASILVLTAGILGSVSCKKKDDEDANIVYVNGSLSFELPEFILPNQLVRMTPTGLTHPDGGEIGYYWKVTPTMTTSDTTRYLNGLDKADDTGKPSDGTFTHTFSDTLKTYTVYCFAFSEDYSTSSTNLQTTVVEPGPEKSLTGTGINADTDPNILVDDNRFYYTTIGELDWFRQNLSYTETGIPFRNGAAMDGVFGRFYNYEDAMNACPEGWRLPTDQEWAEMADIVLGTEKASEYIHNTIPGITKHLISDIHFNGIKMWEYWPAVGEADNKSQLSMIAAGYSNLGNEGADGKYPNATFKGAYEYAAFWTADMTEDGKMAYYRYIYCNQPELRIGKGDKTTFGASVRCVR